VLTCISITCCMFKAGKCYETKSSEILHKMVFLQNAREGLCLLMPDNKRTREPFITSALFSHLLHATQLVLCSKLCSLNLFVTYAALAVSVTDLNIKFFWDMTPCLLVIIYRRLGTIVLLYNIGKLLINWAFYSRII
jgi:hypothetical protein